MVFPDFDATYRHAASSGPESAMYSPIDQQTSRLRANYRLLRAPYSNVSPYPAVCQHNFAQHPHLMYNVQV